MLQSLAKKPNIRKIFSFDRGYIGCDADLKGADAQVVAWEANDLPMKAALRTGVKIHAQTATEFYGAKFTSALGETGNKHTPKGRMYDDIKRATHGTNYGASGRTLATNLGWPRSEGERFHNFWLNVAHPGIGEWHKRTERALRTTGRARNVFGYDITYFDRVDGLLPEALAWIPQSTVALVSFMSAVRIKEEFPFVEFLLQVHDSIVFQIPISCEKYLPRIHAALSVVVPYPDPLVIGSKLQISRSTWGEMEEWKEGESP